MVLCVTIVERVFFLVDYRASKQSTKILLAEHLIVELFFLLCPLLALVVLGRHKALRN